MNQYLTMNYSQFLFFPHAVHKFPTGQIVLIVVQTHSSYYRVFRRTIILFIVLQSYSSHYKDIRRTTMLFASLKRYSSYCKVIRRPTKLFESAVRTHKAAATASASQRQLFVNREIAVPYKNTHIQNTFCLVCPEIRSRAFRVRRACLPSPEKDRNANRRKVARKKHKNIWTFVVCTGDFGEKSSSS